MPSLCVERWEESGVYMLTSYKDASDTEMGENWAEETSTAGQECQEYRFEQNKRCFLNVGSRLKSVAW